MALRSLELSQKLEGKVKTGFAGLDYREQNARREGANKNEAVSPNHPLTSHESNSTRKVME